MNSGLTCGRSGCVRVVRTRIYLTGLLDVGGGWRWMFGLGSLGVLEVSVR
jgi:hypothetical protein